MEIDKIKYPQQLNLFAEIENIEQISDVNNYSSTQALKIEALKIEALKIEALKIEALKIDGLKYIPDYIDDETFLLQQIDSSSWLNDLQRRVQHYGYKYDYQTKNVNFDNYLGELPQYLMQICEKMLKNNLIEQMPNQVIVNEYQPGQGILAHIDHPTIFGDTICSLSLGSPCVMNFTYKLNKIQILLEPRSLLILTGAARYQWKHAIAARKIDKYEMQNGLLIIQRKRRISLTFRNFIQKIVKK